MLAIRTALLEAMSELPAQPEHLKRSGIGRIVMKMANNKQETRDNRTMARNLVEAWARPVVGKVGDMKSLEAMTARRAPVDSQAARVDHNQDDAGEIFEREGEESKNRARVRVPQFNDFAFTVRPASTADPARRRASARPRPTRRRAGCTSGRRSDGCSLGVTKHGARRTLGFGLEVPTRSASACAPRPRRRRLSPRRRCTDARSQTDTSRRPSPPRGRSTTEGARGRSAPGR